MTVFDLDDTIAAIASGTEPAPRGTIRVSGPDAIDCARRVFQFASCRSGGRDPLKDLKSAAAFDGHLQLAAPLQPIKCRVYLWPNQHSYTRQPSAEFHLIGALPILNAALRQICSAGARLAEPGEFTLRAFMAGRLDLTQAEAVLGVIDARDQQELNVALTQLAGGLAAPLAALRNQLIDLLAHLEAGLDFVEEDIEFISRDVLSKSLTDIQKQIEQIQSRMTERDATDQLPGVVLFGWPNTGKSSLFNALGQSDRAIVAEISGTTRDYLEQTIVVDDLSFRLIDTAGIEISSLDGIGISANALTDTQRRQSDLKLFCLDSRRELNDWEREQLEVLDETTIIVLTKCDTVGEGIANCPSFQSDHASVKTSSTTGLGIAELIRMIHDRLMRLNRSSHSVVAETARRSADSLSAAAEAIGQAIEIAEMNLGEELAAAELRNSLEQLGRVVGAVYTDDILDRVFSRFCIGK